MAEKKTDVKTIKSQKPVRTKLCEEVQWETTSNQQKFSRKYLSSYFLWCLEQSYVGMPDDGW